MTPQVRSRNLLRSEGYTVATVEQWLPRLKIRKDLFTIGDLLAVAPGRPVLLVQVTSGSNLAARRTKALAAPGLAAWLRTGHAEFELHGWRKGGAAGARKLWTCRREALTLDDLTPAETTAEFSGVPLGTPENASGPAQLETSP
jgi:hypothetical protein